MPKLILKKRAEILKEFELGGKSIYFLGSDPRNDFVVIDQKVSIKHLKIENSENQYYVEDLNSAFGTLLNGKPLHTRAQIVEGDEIAIGALSLIFENGNTPRIPAPEDTEQYIEVIGEEDFPEQSFKPESNVFGGKNRPRQETEEFYEIEDLPGEPKPVTNGTYKSTGAARKSYYLLTIDGPYIGKRFALNQRDTRIGRDNTLNDIVIRNNEDGALDPSISRRHATISYRDGKYFISDKRSKTRTYVNQIKLSPTEELRIQENDEIEIVSDQKSTIFRMLPDGQYDISPPRKTSVWWNRNKLRLGTLLTLALGCLTLAALGWSWQHRSTGAEQPEELEFIEETWHTVESSHNGEGDQAAPKPSGLALSDLSGDDKIDLLFTDSAGRLHALDGTTKRTLWRIDHLSIQDHIPVVTADLNSDGTQDVLAVASDSRLRALDGRNGAEIWLSPLLGETISGAPVVADFNDDGFQDVLVAVENGRIHLGHGHVYGMDWTIIETGLTLLATPSAADWDGDGTVESFLGSEEGKVLVIDGSRGKVAIAFDFNEEVSKATGTIFGEHNLRYPIALSDITNDQVTDLIVGATNGNYLALEGQSLKRIWFESLPVVFTNSEPLSPVISDFDNDGFADVALVSNQMIRVIPGGDIENRKSVLWEYNLAGEDVFISSPSLTDIDNDGISDLIIGTKLGTIVIFDGKNGRILTQLNSQYNPACSPIVTADVGADGYLDMMVMRQDGHIYRIQTNTPIHENNLIWGQNTGDARHSGRYAYVPPTPSTTDAMGAAFGLLTLGVGFLTFSSKQKRKKSIKKNQNA